MEEDGFIKATGFTEGNVHDSQCFTQLLSGKEAQVYADSAYASAAANTWLAECEIENCVLERVCRKKLLTEKQKHHNKKCSPIRSIVERSFGVMKIHYGMAKRVTLAWREMVCILV